MSDLNEIKTLKNRIAELEEKLESNNKICEPDIYKMIFSTLPIGLFYYDINGVITDCNEKFAEIVGAPKEILIGLPTLTKLENKAVISCIKESLIKGESYYEGPYTSVSGDKSIYSRGIFRGIRDSDNNIVKGVCVIEDITELHETQNKIQIAEQNYRIIFDNSPVPMIVHSMGKVVLINNAVVKLAKIKDPNKVIGQSVLNFVHEDFKSKAINNMQNVLNGKGVVLHEEKFVSLENEVFDVLVSSSLFNYNGENALLVAFMDVSEIKTFKKQIDIITKGIENSHVSVIITNSKWEIEYVNPKFTELTKYTLDEVKGKSTEIIKSNFHSNDFYARLEKTLSSGKSWRGEICSVRKDGDLFWEYAVISPILDENNNVINIISVKEDITQRKKYEERIINNENHLKTLFETAPDGIFEIDKDGRIVNCNAKFADSVNLEKDIILGSVISDFVTNKIKFGKLFKKLKEVGYFKSEIRQESFDGTQTSAWVRATALYDSENIFNGAIAFSSDITEMKKSEQLLIEAKEKAVEADRLKSAFLSNMSHEIRTPLNAIIGFSSLITKSHIDDDIKQKYSTYIKQSSDSLLNIIDDIIDFSKIEANQLEIINEVFLVNDLLNEIYDIFSEELNAHNKIGIELIINCKPDIYIKSDEYRLKQIISNLLSNAIKFTLKGTIEFGCYLKGSKVVFYVSDTGIGISEDKLDIIFKQFVKFDTTKKQRGTGIGLSIVKSLTNLLGGKVKIQTNLGEGSKFEIVLPYDENIEYKPKQIDETYGFSTTVDWSGKTILVAEDDNFNFLVIDEFLSTTKANIIHAKNGEEVVSLYKTLKNKIDVVLMDIQMPKLNGYKATEQILTINPKAKVIAQTAYAMADEKEGSIKSGCCDYISKPIDEVLLVETINRHI